MALVLNKSQAEAIFNAMCALNNVGARAHIRISQGREHCVLHAVEYEDSTVSIYEGDAVGNPFGRSERHTDQNAFAAAYGIA